MLFLLEYNRPEGKLVTFRTFDAAQRNVAQDARLELELDLNRRGVEHEVVILEADSEADIRRSHRRYFEDLPTLWRAMIEALTRAASRERSPGCHD